MVWMCYLSGHGVPHGFLRGQQAAGKVGLVGEWWGPRGKLAQGRSAGGIGEV